MPDGFFVKMKKSATDFTKLKFWFFQNKMENMEHVC